MFIFSCTIFFFILFYFVFAGGLCTFWKKWEKKSGWVGGVWPSRHMTCTNQTRASCCCPHVGCSFLIFWATVRAIQSLRLWKRRKISKMPRAKQSARRKKFDYNRNRKNVKTKNKKKSNPRIEQWVLACVLILVGMMQKHVVKAAAKTYQCPEKVDCWSHLFHLDKVFIKESILYF